MSATTQKGPTLEELSEDMEAAQQRIHRLERDHSELKADVNTQFWVFGVATVISWLSIKGLGRSFDVMQNRIDKALPQPLTGREAYDLLKAQGRL